MRTVSNYAVPHDPALTKELEEHPMTSKSQPQEHNLINLNIPQVAKEQSKKKFGPFDTVVAVKSQFGALTLTTMELKKTKKKSAR